jgi:hypothetical protein
VFVYDVVQVQMPLFNYDFDLDSNIALQISSTICVDKRLCLLMLGESVTREVNAKEQLIEPTVTGKRRNGDGINCRSI